MSISVSHQTGVHRAVVSSALVCCQRASAGETVYSTNFGMCGGRLLMHVRYSWTLWKDGLLSERINKSVLGTRLGTQYNSLRAGVTRKGI
jgi:hypothetical protein